MPDDTTPTSQSSVVAETTKTAVKANLKAAGIEARAIWPETQDGLMLLRHADTTDVRLIPESDWNNQWGKQRRFEVDKAQWDKLSTPDLSALIEAAQITPDDLVYAFASNWVVSRETLTEERAKHVGQALLHNLLSLV